MLTEEERKALDIVHKLAGEAIGFSGDHALWQIVYRLTRELRFEPELHIQRSKPCPSKN